MNQMDYCTCSSLFWIYEVFLFSELLLARDFVVLKKTKRTKKNPFVGFNPANLSLVSCNRYLYYCLACDHFYP
jgi:hypothetical protein